MAMSHSHSVQQCFRQSELCLRDELSNIRAPHPSEQLLLLTLDARSQAAAGRGSVEELTRPPVLIMGLRRGFQLEYGVPESVLKICTVAKNKGRIFNRCALQVLNCTKLSLRWSARVPWFLRPGVLPDR